MAKNVVAFMDAIEDARSLIDDLIAQGIERGAISIVAKAPEGESLTEEGTNHLTDERMAGVTRGFGAGAGIGGVAGLVAGIAAFTIPGAGAVIAGPLATTLAGLGIGAFTGGVFGAIRNLGISEEEAEYYAEGVNRGGILVSVEVDEAEAGRVADIMRYHGAVDIGRRAEEWRSAGWQGHAARGDEGSGEPDRPHH